MSETQGTVSSNNLVEFEKLSKEWHKVQHINWLRKAKTWRGYIHKKLNVELGKLLDHFGVPFYKKFIYYAFAHELAKYWLDTDGGELDYFFEICYKKHISGRNLEDYVDHRVIEGIKEILMRFQVMREGLKVEWDSIRLMKEWEKSGRKVDWYSMLPIELEFADEEKANESVKDKDKVGKRGG